NGPGQCRLSGLVLGLPDEGVWHGPQFPHRRDPETLAAAWRKPATADRSAAARPACRGCAEPERRSCRRECPRLDRQEHAADVGFGRWRAALSLGGLDRSRRLRHAERHLSAAANGANVVFEGIL